ncbi:hypothetical protein AAMO2058_000683100 [Amorphochlora amoebiformis]
MSEYTKKINWPAEWKDAAGEETIAKRSAVESPIKLYTSWFCPFAQRAWIALEEKNIDYQWIEINPYEIDEKEPGGYTKKALPLPEKKKRFPGFVETSPSGLVPGIDNNGEKVWDSLIVVEYINDAFKEGPELMPSDPLSKSRVRYWSGYVTDVVQKNYYAMLISQDAEVQENFRQKFFDSCRIFSRQMANTDEGAYFLGEQFSMVDIAFAPFWQRFLWVGGHYRDLKFPTEEKEFKRLNIWWDTVSKRPSVARTLVCKPRLLSSYKQYSRNEATSNYGKMIQGILGKSGKKSTKAYGANIYPIAVATGLALGSLAYVGKSLFGKKK